MWEWLVEIAWRLSGSRDTRCFTQNQVVTSPNHMHNGEGRKTCKWKGRKKELNYADWMMMIRYVARANKMGGVWIERSTIPLLSLSLFPLFTYEEKICISCLLMHASTTTTTFTLTWRRSGLCREKQVTWYEQCVKSK